MICESHIVICEGMIPVTVRPPNLLNLSTTLPTVRMVVDVSKASAVLTTAFIIRVLRSKVTRTALIIASRISMTSKCLCGC